MTTGQDDYLPISMLNQLEYCERRFYLMHVLGEMEVNAHVLEGSIRHEQVHLGARVLQLERQTSRTRERNWFITVNTFANSYAPRPPTAGDCKSPAQLIEFR